MSLSNEQSIPFGVTDLTSMPYSDFKDVVEADCKARLDEMTSHALRDPLVQYRWYEALIGIQKSVEGQLAAIGADARHRTARSNAKVTHIHGRFTGIEGQEAAEERRNQLRKTRQERLESEAELERWRASALRFKTGVEERLAEARSLLHEQDFFEERALIERNQALARVLVLESAIRTWRDSFTPEDEPTPEDRELMKYVGS